MPSKNKNKKRSKRKSHPRRLENERSIPRVITGQGMLRALSKPPRQSVVICHKWVADSRAAQTISDSFGALDFRLSNTDASALAAYFEEYMISKVEVFFRPMYRANSVSSLAYMPIIYVRPDPVDGGTWTSVADARASDGVITMDDSAGFCVTFSPRINAYVYSGSSVPSGDPGPMWLSTGDTGVRHYGLKWAITGGGASATEFQEWNVSIREEVRLRIAKRSGASLQSPDPEPPGSPFEEIKD